MQVTHYASFNAAGILRDFGVDPTELTKARGRTDSAPSAFISIEKLHKF